LLVEQFILHQNQRKSCFQFIFLKRATHPFAAFLVLQHILYTAIYLLLNNWKFLISLKHTTEEYKTKILILWSSKL